MMSAQPAHTHREEDDLAEDEAAFEAALRGEFVTHATVKRWLASKDTPTPLSRPDFGE
jgi:predicted transcriptional regulator